MDKQRILYMLYVVLATALSACSFGDEPSVCPYNVRMEYWYAESSAENSLPVYVDNIRQFLFDSDGNQLAAITLRGDSSTGWNAQLKDGTYPLVLWGNLGENGKETATILTDNNYNMNEMTLSAAITGVPPGYRNNTSRLYYGTATFTLKDGITEHRRVYLSHAHAAMNVTVQWRTAEKPSAEGLWPLADAPERYPRPLRLHRRNRANDPFGHRHLCHPPERQDRYLSRDTRRHELRQRSHRRIRNLPLHLWHPRVVEPLARRRADHPRPRPQPLFLQAPNGYEPEHGARIRPADHCIRQRDHRHTNNCLRLGRRRFHRINNN